MTNSPLQIVLLPKYNAVTGKQLPDPEEGLHISAPTSPAGSGLVTTPCQQNVNRNTVCHFQGQRPGTPGVPSVLVPSSAEWESRGSGWQESSRRRGTVCALRHFGPVGLFAMLCTVAHQKLFCPWDSPGKNAEWVSISFSRVSSQPIDQTHTFCNSCVCRWIAYHWATWEAP